MGLSETILAAMIGATATVGTALFQLLTAFKARGKPDVKPKRGTTARSIFAVVALMVASAAGGFLYSQFLREREGEDIRAMRQELRELRDLTAATVMERGHFPPDSTPAPGPAQNETPTAMSASLESTSGVTESIAYVPACRIDSGSNSAAECQEADAQRIALCGSVPTAARVSAIQLFAQPDAVQQPWDQHGATLETDLGGARFTGKTFEYAQSADVKAVCMNFLHWSSQHPHIARIVVQYQIGDAAIEAAEPAPAPAIQAEPVLTQTAIATEGIQASSQPASFATPAAAVVR